MEQVIIYMDDNNYLVVVYPNYQENINIQELIERTVPADKPYKIMNKDELPTDYSTRDLWYIDTTELVDGVGIATIEQG